MKQRGFYSEGGTIDLIRRGWNCFSRLVDGEGLEVKRGLFSNDKRGVGGSIKKLFQNFSRAFLFSSL